MNILIISSFYPMHDRLGGDHRFFRLLEGLVGTHRLYYLAYSPETQVEQYGQEATDKYRNDVASLGMEILRPGVRVALQSRKYDVVIFQYYFHALPWVDEVRTFQPWARVVVDNGDVAYRRFMSKADLTGKPEDRIEAERIKHDELAAYRSADAILTVSQEDLDVVKAEIPGLCAFIIPNIHPIPEKLTTERQRSRLIFVGSYLHAPNVDGVLWFVHDILPLIAQSRPDVRLSVVGYGPPPEILALASDRVEVIGYVPETAPYLEAASISIAPLRYGAGVKGKIGEAMAYHLPVVTTNIGIDGFGLTPGINVLVGDSPQAFAEYVIRLLDDPMLHRDVAEAGYLFIREHFSEKAVSKRVREMISALPTLPINRLPFSVRLPILIDAWMEKNVRWRLRKSHNQ